MRGRWLAALLLVAGCAKGAPDDHGEHAAPVGAGEPPPELVSASEIQRAKDACADYVTRACACAATVPAATKVCELAKGEPEAIRVSLEVSQSPDSSRKDAIDAQRTVRKIAKACVEELAQLPALGCK